MPRPKAFLSDDEILCRVQRGERDAYGALFDRYYARVEGYARRRLHDAEAARDVASETFLRAFQNVDKFRTDQAVPYFGYLLLICHRIILSEQARFAGALARQRALVVSGRGTDRANWQEVPLYKMLVQERDRALRASLDRLPPDDREIIRLAFEQGLSRREIAAAMRKPSVSAVTSHLHRAMLKLRRVVVQQGYFGPLGDTGGHTEWALNGRGGAAHSPGGTIDA